MFLFSFLLSVTAATEQPNSYPRTLRLSLKPHQKSFETEFKNNERTLTVLKRNQLLKSRRTESLALEIKKGEEKKRELTCLVRFLEKISSHLYEMEIISFNKSVREYKVSMDELQGNFNKIKDIYEQTPLETLDTLDNLDIFEVEGRKHTFINWIVKHQEELDRMRAVVEGKHP